MPKLLIQAGHEGRTTGSTGAPNEQSFNVDVSNQVADQLRARGFEVKRVNADPTPEEIAGDWDLFLAIHYDANIYGSGGFFEDVPMNDGVPERSKQIAYLLRQEYGGTTGIAYHPERRNANTWDYYMWRKVSWNTPCVLIECGVGMHVPDDWEILHHNRPLVVAGLVKGLCVAFNVPYEVSPPPTPEPPPETPTEPTNPCADKDKEIADLTSMLTALNAQITALNAEVDRLSSNDAQARLNAIHDVLYGSGFWWTKWAKIKALLPK